MTLKICCFSVVDKSSFVGYGRLEVSSSDPLQRRRSLRFLNSLKATVFKGLRSGYRPYRFCCFFCFVELLLLILLLLQVYFAISGPSMSCSSDKC